MITIVYTTILLGIIVLPLVKSAEDPSKPVIYKIDKDTSEATYAINEHGFLEDITGKQVAQPYID